MIKRIFAVLLCVLAAQAVADNTPEQATTIEVGITYKARIEVAGDSDWAKFYLDRPGRVVITMEVPEKLDYDLDLYNADAPAGLVGTSMNDVGATEVIRYDAPSEGWYYLKRYGFKDHHDANAYYYTKVEFESVDPHFEIYGKVDNFVGGVDADNDGFYETFSFRLGFDPDELNTGTGYELYAKFVSEQTGQSWWSGPKIIVQGDEAEYYYAEFDERAFLGHINGNTMLNFSVELWSGDKETKLASDVSVAEAPLPVDSIVEYTVSARVQNFTPGIDHDNDGYFESYDFSIAVDPDELKTSGTYPMYVKVVSKTTEQSWWSQETVNVSGPGNDEVVYPINETFFDGRIAGNTVLDFAVELWDQSKSVMLASTDSVSGEQNVKVDYVATEPPQTVQVLGTMQYMDIDGVVKALRYARVGVFYNKDNRNIVLYTSTDGSGKYQVEVPNIESDGSGADIYVRVYSTGLNGAYPGSSSGIGFVRDTVLQSSYFMQSDTVVDNVRKELIFNLTASNEGDNAGAFAVYDSIVTGFEYSFKSLGKAYNTLSVWWPDEETYYDNNNGMHLRQGDRWDRDVILHEYAHYMAHQSGVMSGEVGDPSHSWDQDLREYVTTRTDQQARNLAFREAWANFFAVAAVHDINDDSADVSFHDLSDHDDRPGNYVKVQNLETCTIKSSVEASVRHTPGDFYEDMNSCALWDIYDRYNHATDDRDSVLGTDLPEIWQVIRTGASDNMEAFFGDWFGRNARAGAITQVMLDHKMTFVAQMPHTPTPDSGANLDATILRWEGENATSYRVYVGTTANLGKDDYLGETTGFSWTLGALQEATTYYWQVVGVNGQSLAYGPVWQFSTIDYSPDVVTLAASDIGKNTSRFNAQVNPNGRHTNLDFHYGETADYGFLIHVGHIGNDTLALTRGFTVAGLKCETTYHYRAVAISESGTEYGGDQVFTTGSCQNPLVTTEESTGRQLEKVTLNATVNPSGLSTRLYFDWGTVSGYYSNSVDYGNVGSANQTLIISHAISDLTCSNTYYYRARAVNSSGTSYGVEKEVATADCVTITTGLATDITKITAQAHASVNPNGFDTRLYWEFGKTVDLGREVPWGQQGQNPGDGGSIGNGTTMVQYASLLSPLECDEKYYVRARADFERGSVYGETVSFTTDTCALPTVITGIAQGITSIGATLLAQVNPNGLETQLYFDIGPTTDYGLSFAAGSAGSGDLLVPMQSILSTLECSTLYHYRARAENASGVVVGEDMEVKTKGCPDIVFTIKDATKRLRIDADGDGYYSQFDIIFDANVSEGTHDVYAELFMRRPGESWEKYATSTVNSITTDRPDDTIEVGHTLPADLIEDHFDIRIDLYKHGELGMKASWSSANDPDLKELPLEGIDNDNPLKPIIRVEPLQLSFEEPVQGQSPAGAVLQQHDNSVVKFARGAIDPSEQLAALAKNAKDQDDAQLMMLQGLKGHHVLMQFNHHLTPQSRQALARQGIKILQYVPDNTYWVSVLDNFKPDEVTAAGGIYWASKVSAEYKLSPSLDVDETVALRGGIEGVDEVLEVGVLFFNDVSRFRAQSLLLNLPTVQIIGWPSDHMVTVSIDRSELKGLLNNDIVQWVEPAPAELTNYNLTAAKRIKVDKIRQQSWGNLSGHGVKVGVWDGGAVYQHTDFGSRLTNPDNGSLSQHATHVAGTIGGSGAGNQQATGMAPEATIVSYDWNSDTTEMRAAKDTGIVLSNHSYGVVAGWTWNNGWTNYGDYWFGIYSNVTAEWDDIVYDNDLIIFKAAGNDRHDGPGCPSGSACDGPYESIGTRGVAKNIITIGATTDSDSMTIFSGWGPTDDGRIKPDLVANGDGLYSTLIGNSYGNMTGTSMASPSAAGSGTLLFEHFNKVNGYAPGAATLKGIMIHGAKDLGRTGPDYEYGWGLIDAERSAQIITDHSWRTEMLEQTQAIDKYTISTDSRSSLLKFTLVWTDPAGAPGGSKDLVNNLDLVLVAPDGSEHLAWVLNPANPGAPATRGINTRDNVEQVVVNNPMAGVWSVKVIGAAINDGPQSYTLVGDVLGGASDGGGDGGGGDGGGDGGGGGDTPPPPPPPLPEAPGFNIYNDGERELRVFDIVPELPAPWVSLGPVSGVIQPGSSMRVTVRVNFDRAPTGETGVRLLVTSDDYDLSPYPNGVYINTVRVSLDDIDKDGIHNLDDNCPEVRNTDQLDTDGDRVGDACDDDDDNDGIPDADDFYPLDPDKSQEPDKLADIRFNSDKLSQCLRDQLGQPAYISDITEVNCDSKAIADLAGIENLQAILKLSLNDNLISDIGPLDRLDAMRELLISDNQIVDISVVARLSIIRKLVMSNNRINDILPILVPTVPDVPPVINQLLHVDFAGNPDIPCWQLDYVETYVKPLTWIRPNSCANVSGDADNDGLADSEEIIRGTNPLVGDTDGDGMGDGFEVRYGLDPLNGSDAEGDPDLDGLSNLDEFLAGTNPNSSDTDNDGFSDNVEIGLGLDPTDPSDIWIDNDGDKLPLILELLRGLDPNLKDNNVFADRYLLIQQIYIDIWYRLATQEEIDYWRARLESGESLPADIYGALLDEETFELLTFVGRVFMATLQRTPTNEELREWRDFLAAGGLKLDMVTKFVASEAFLSEYGPLSDEEFVRLIFETVMGRDVTPDELGDYLDRLDTAVIDRSQMMLEIIDSDEYKDDQEAVQRIGALSLLLIGEAPSPEQAAQLKQLLANGGDTNGVLNALLASDGFRKTLVDGISDADADSDNDGIPDGVEFTGGTNVAYKDNDVVGKDDLFVKQMLRDLVGETFSDKLVQEQMTVLNGLGSRTNWVKHLMDDQRFDSSRLALSRLYYGFFAKQPSHSALMYWIGGVESGMSLSQVAERWYMSQEFKYLYGYLRVDEYVRLVYQNVLNRPPTTTELSTWVAKLRSGQVSPGAMMVSFTQSADNAARHLNRDQVVVLFNLLYRRSPSEVELNTWRRKVDSGMDIRALVNSIINSTEYQGRFY